MPFANDIAARLCPTGNRDCAMISALHSADTQLVLQEVRTLRDELMETLDALRRWDEERFERRTRQAHRAVKRGLDTGCRSEATMGILIRRAQVAATPSPPAWVS